MIARKSIGIVLVISFLVIFGFGKEKEKPKSFPQTYPEGLPREIVSEKDGALMVLIPGGSFEMGTDTPEISELVQWEKQWNSKVKADSFEDETPRHTVYLDAFYMDVHEVTNAQYRQFIETTGHHEPQGIGYVDGKWKTNFEPWKDSNFNAPNQPVVCVSWEDAVAYCEWAGKRLPTEAEWEKAARGGLVGKRYPWGNEVPNGTQCNFADRNTNFNWSDKEANDGYQYSAPVSSFTANRYGLYDMLGNVFEWCADKYDSSYYAKSPRENPQGPSSGIFGVLRGGSWNYFASVLRIANRYKRFPIARDALCGFRCARDVTP